MNDYETLKKFWDDTFKAEEVYDVSSRWIKDEKFNSILSNYIPDNGVILDYGCGTGWATYEARLFTKFRFAVGIDTSGTGINLCSEIASKNRITNLTFVRGDESTLHNLTSYFDFIMSFNVIDVVEDKVNDLILKALRDSLKPDGHVFIGLNPDFSEDELVNLLKLEKRGNLYYKDGILRANKKSISEWTNYLSQYFEVVEQFKFALTPNEEKYPRVGYLLKLKK